MNVAPSKRDLGPTQEAAPPAPALRIVILEGEDVSNNIKERTAREPIVQVEDENHKPVAGAAVLFTRHYPEWPCGRKLSQWREDLLRPN